MIYQFEHLSDLTILTLLFIYLKHLEQPPTFLLQLSFSKFIEFGSNLLISPDL